MLLKQPNSLHTPVFGAAGALEAALPVPSLSTLGKAAMAAVLRLLSERGHLEQLALADCTCGNGHDSLFLSQCLAELKGGERCPLLAFDVQGAALDATEKRLAPASAAPSGAAQRRLVTKSGGDVRLLLAGHEHLAVHLQAQAPGRALALAVYNLGFLPGSDKRLVTLPASTLASLEQAAHLLAPGGLVCVHAYAGHAGGQDELTAVTGWFQALPSFWHSASYGVCNKARNPERLFLAHLPFTPHSPHVAKRA